MYIPEPFKEDRIDVLHDAIRRAGLATLVSVTPAGLIASHIPLLLDPEPAPYGTLLGHLARPNPQARGATGDALAIFLGPIPTSRRPGIRVSTRPRRSCRPGIMSPYTPMGRSNSSTMPSTPVSTSRSLPPDMNKVGRTRGLRPMLPRILSPPLSGESSGFG